MSVRMSPLELSPENVMVSEALQELGVGLHPGLSKKTEKQRNTTPTQRRLHLLCCVSGSEVEEVVPRLSNQIMSDMQQIWKLERILGALHKRSAK